MHQPEVALFDEIRERHAAAQVALGNVDHEPEVVLDHRLPCSEIAGLRGACRPVFLVGCEEFGASDLAQVDRQCIGAFATDQLGHRAVDQRSLCGQRVVDAFYRERILVLDFLVWRR